MSDARDRTITEIAAGVSDLVAQVASYRTLLRAALDGWHTTERELKQTRKELYRLRDEQRVKRRAA
ncbi:MAG TPA: hypothetical protein QF572_11525 [Vicinamibacterales bacterium]|nr:hypothetical protein [Vicinamibacterales bacterium]